MLNLSVVEENGARRMKVAIKKKTAAYYCSIQIQRSITSC